jgi:hypothetical protein
MSGTLLPVTRTSAIRRLSNNAALFTSPAPVFSQQAGGVVVEPTDDPYVDTAVSRHQRSRRRHPIAAQPDDRAVRPVD